MISKFNIANEMLMLGEDTTDDEAERDLMEHCVYENIKLNHDILKCKMKELFFLDHFISDASMSADRKKVSVVRKMPKPWIKADVHRFIGTYNYLSTYATHLNAFVKPLWVLTQDDSDFIWSTVQQDAFDKARQIKSSASVLLL